MRDMRVQTVAALLLLASSHVQALNLDTGISVGMRYTDNAALRSSNEEDDWIATATVGASLIDDTGPFTASASGSLSHLNYLNDTFGDQDYMSLGAVAAWEQIAGSLVWNARDYYGQTSVNSLGAVTPSNVQNTNVFSVGPDFLFMLSPRNQVNLGLEFLDFYYEDSNADNQQYALTTGWLYQMYPTMAVGLSGGVRDVSYDDNPDYTSTNLGFVLNGSRPRSTYTVNLGARHIDRDGFDNQDGFSGSIDWLYDMTGKSSVRAYLSSDITDSSGGLYNSLVDPDTGNPANVQTSGDVLTSNIARLTYSRVDSALNSRVWAELRDLDYDDSPNDRDVQEFGALMNYQLSSLITTGLRGNYIRRKEHSPKRTDKEYFLAGTMGYNLSRKLSCNFELRYQKRDSTRSLSEYDEVSAFAGLSYGLGGQRSGGSVGSSISGRRSYGGMGSSF